MLTPKLSREFPRAFLSLHVRHLANNRLTHLWSSLSTAAVIAIWVHLSCPPAQKTYAGHPDLTSSVGASNLVLGSGRKGGAITWPPKSTNLMFHDFLCSHVQSVLYERTGQVAKSNGGSLQLPLQGWAKIAYLLDVCQAAKEKHTEIYWPKLSKLYLISVYYFCNMYNTQENTTS